MAVGSIMGILYADDGLTVLWEPYWLQGAINLFNFLFRRVRLMENVTKFQDHDLPAGGNLRRYFIGVFQLEEHWGWFHIPVAPLAPHPMPGLRDGGKI